MVVLKVLLELMSLFKVCGPVDVLDDKALLAWVHDLRASVNHLSSVINLDFAA
jgi:hypothetical protein